MHSAEINASSRWRRRTQFFGALTMAMVARSAIFAAAFSSRPAPPSSFRSAPPRLRRLHATTGSDAGRTPTGWINPESLDLGASSVRPEASSPPPSPVERVLVRDRIVHVKRDDVLRLPSSNVGGNKARKFLSLNGVPAEEFPDVVVSYGGPQSNAMAALAAIVSSKNAELEGGTGTGGGGEGKPGSGGEGGERDPFWQLDVTEEDSGDGKLEEDQRNNDENETTNATAETIHATSPAVKKRFVYYTKTLPRYLRKNPNGNLLRALALGTEIRPLPHDEYRALFGGLHGGSALAPADLDPPLPGRSLWVPQGGACGAAERGSDALAREIVDYWEEEGGGAKLAAVVPGGTCATALLLRRSIDKILERRREEGGGSMDVEVVVVPCVGDDEYATRQMQSLDRSVGGEGRPEDMPRVLRPSRDAGRGYFSFGAPDAAILETFDEMNAAGLFLDLLYGAPAWTLLLGRWNDPSSDSPIAGRAVMYVHSGGLEGIASQLTRYKHKGLVDAGTIRTP